MATSSCDSPVSLPQHFVKDLVDSGSIGKAISLPSLYISRSPAADALEAVMKKDIPTIDFSLLTSSTPEERSKAVEDLGRACKQWGCFTVMNHGMSESLRTATIEAYAAFFDLTAEERRAYRMEKLFDGICYGTSFNLAGGDVRYWRDFLRTIVHPSFHSPDEPPRFRAISEEYGRQARVISREIVRAIFESLGLEAGDMEEALEMDSCSQILVGNLYPPCPHPALAIGIPPHSDTGLITLLTQSSTFSGLQVLHDGNWVAVHAVPNAFFVHAGDLLEIISNGRYKSVLHRAVVSDEYSRISIASAIGPPLEGFVAPATELVGEGGEAAAFRGIIHKEYVKLHQRNQLSKRSLDALKL